MSQTRRSTDEVLRPAGATHDRGGSLLRGYLHKSSNSLCGIKGYASLIAGGMADSGSAKAWAHKIIAEVERLEDVYRGVRDVAFPEPTAGLGGACLVPVLHDAATTAEQRHDNLTVRIVGSSDGRLLLPAGDLLQVLGAVLDNSAESTAGPVVVEVTTSDDGGQLAVALRDDGPGMNHDLLMQVIDPFVTTRDGHLGIGLARVDTILDMHGLGWGLRSIRGTGTTVTLAVAARLATTVS